MKRCRLIPTLVLPFCLPLCALGQIPLSTLKSGIYQQDFDTLPAPAQQSPLAWTNDGSGSPHGLRGWYLVTTSGPKGAPLTKPEFYVSATSGRLNQVGNVNFGAAGSRDRALGFRMPIKGQTSSSWKFHCGVVFVNDTAASISAFEVSYTGEQWTQNGGGAQHINRLEFGHALLGRTFDARSFVLSRAAARLVLVPELAFAAQDDYNASNRFAQQAPLATARLSARVNLAQPLAPGDHLLLCWFARGSAEDLGTHSLALDDVSVSFAKP